MADRAQIPYLLKLLDDESISIRKSVLDALESIGPELEDELYHLPEPMDIEAKKLIQPILKRNRSGWIKEVWNDWPKLDDEYSRLELALGYLAAFQTGKHHAGQLSKNLDKLAQEFKHNYSAVDVVQLSKFLFQVKGFSGNRNDYYSPLNSNLISIIRSGAGIPISLVCIYMLVGRRLGLTIEGCNFPGHFLARVPYQGGTYLVDCFNGGQFIREKEFYNVKTVPAHELREILLGKVDAYTIVERVIRNLMRAYQYKNDSENGYVMLELLNTMSINRSSLTEPAPELSEPQKAVLFERGQLVRHIRYGYRGVIVDLNERCEADELWYQSNQSQPNRAQPWYHILVHGGTLNTYAAQNNLGPDESGEPVNHPLIPIFFSRFQNGRYIRNDTEWPTS